MVIPVVTSDCIACEITTTSLICISHFSAEPAPERFDSQDLFAVVSFDSESTPSLSLTVMVGSPQTNLFVADSCCE